MKIQITPNAKKTECVGVAKGVLKIRVQAPPADDKSIEMLIHYLAERLGLPRRDMPSLDGETSRRKQIQGLNATLLLEEVERVFCSV